MRNNTIRYKKLATVVSGRKNIARFLVRLKKKTGSKTDKHESQTITPTYTCSSALVLTCFCLTKGRATHFRPDTIITSYFFYYSYGVIIQSVIQTIMLCE